MLLLFPLVLPLLQSCSMISLTVRGTVKTETAGWMGLKKYFGVVYLLYCTTVMMEERVGAGGLFKTVAHQNDDAKGDQHACSVSPFCGCFLLYRTALCSECAGSRGALY